MGFSAPASACQATIDGLGWPDPKPLALGCDWAASGPCPAALGGGVDGLCRGSLRPQTSWSAVLSSPGGRHRLSSQGLASPGSRALSVPPPRQQGGPCSSQKLESPFASSQGISPFVQASRRGPGPMTFHLHPLVCGQRPSPSRGGAPAPPGTRKQAFLLDEPTYAVGEAGPAGPHLTRHLQARDSGPSPAQPAPRAGSRVHSVHSGLESHLSHHLSSGGRDAWEPAPVPPRLPSQDRPPPSPEGPPSMSEATRSSPLPPQPRGASSSSAPAN